MYVCVYIYIYIYMYTHIIITHAPAHAPDGSQKERARGDDICVFFFPGVGIAMTVAAHVRAT